MKDEKLQPPKNKLQTSSFKLPISNLQSLTSPRSLFILHCSLFILLAVAYNFANPLFEGIDEIRHFRYVRYIALNKSLPPVSSNRQRRCRHITRLSITSSRR